MKLFPFLVLLASLAACPRMLADEKLPQDRMVGDWININAAGTRGVTRVAITKKGGAWSIELWGKAHPQDHPSGKTELHLLGADVGAKALDHGMATWDFQFKVQCAIVHIEEDRLIVETYNIFRDGSGRSNYRSREVFKRAE